MTRGGLRVLWRAAPCWALGAVAMVAALRFLERPSLYPLGALALALCGCVAGLCARWALGELTMAWCCPRLDALGLRPDSREAPWAALQTAEEVLRLFRPAARRFPAYFPEGQAEVAKAARGALAAHRRKVEALAQAHRLQGFEAPWLEKAEAAQAELWRLERSLQAIRAHLVEVLSPPSPELPVALDVLEGRSEALAAALQEASARPAEVRS